MKNIIIIRGPLGVGKTTVSKKLAEYYQGIHFSIDDVLAEHGLDKVEGEGIPLRNFIKANKIILPQAKEAVAKKKVVVIDGNFYHKKQLDHLTETFPENTAVFTLKAPVEICLKRDAARERSYGEDATRVVHMFVSRFDAGKVIDTQNQTVDETVQSIISELE